MFKSPAAATATIMLAPTMSRLTKQLGRDFIRSRPRRRTGIRTSQPGNSGSPSSSARSLRCARLRRIRSRACSLIMGPPSRPSSLSSTTFCCRSFTSRTPCTRMDPGSGSASCGAMAGSTSFLASSMSRATTSPCWPTATRISFLRSSSTSGLSW